MAVEKHIIDKVIGQHPARSMDFDTLYTGLMEQVEQRFINHTKRGELELFNYSNNTVFDKNWNLFTLISRGLILAPKTKTVIATPFPKFFNYGETEIWDADKLDGEILALEKLDGSLGIVYHYAGEWHCATRGSFTSHQAQWGKQWLHKNVDTSKLNIGHTYLFEIIYPENRIVINYDYEAMVLLSAFCDTGFEYNSQQLHTLHERINVKKAALLPFKDLANLIEQAEKIDKNNEGWVVRFPNGHKVKIKGSEYCRLHRLMSNVTPLGVWNVMLSMDNIPQIRKELPEEHLKDFDAIKAILDKQLDDLLSEITAAKQASKSMTDKEVGLTINGGKWADGREVTPVEKKFLFLSRNFDLEKVFEKEGKARQNIFKYIKPTANELQDYTPSQAINRFQDEAG